MCTYKSHINWWLNPTIETIVGEFIGQLKCTNPTICVFHKQFMHSESWSWGYVWNLHQTCGAWSLEGYGGTNPCWTHIQVPNAWYQHTLLILVLKNLVCDMYHNCNTTLMLILGGQHKMEKKNLRRPKSLFGSILFSHHISTCILFHIYI